MELILSTWSDTASLEFLESQNASEKLVREVETMKYVRLRTSIPVPEVYYYDFNLTNSVGAQFMLLERKPGRHLYKIWDKLSLDHKKVAC